jgi:integrase
MPRLLYRPPKYRLHKPTGQAVVSLCGRQVYLGKYGSPKSHERYEQEIAKWRRSLAADANQAANQAAAESLGRITPVTLRDRRRRGHALTLNELVLVFVEHARKYYRKNGEVTREAGQIAEMLGLLRARHGTLPVEDFGPVLLKAFREELITERGWARGHLNKQVSRLVRMYRWAVENELASPECYAALKAVPGLKKGRTDARESKGVSCVEDAVVDKTLPGLPKVVAAMVRLQRLTGARPGEICALRPGDVDRSGKVWVYIPSSHKTEHFEKGRVVMIGPQAQEVLTPFLNRPARQACFTPRDSEMQRFASLAARRKTPPRSRDKAGAAKRANRRYAPSYTPDTYRHAVQRVCKRLGIAKWSPNQLRHTAATAIRKMYGLEAAQVVCGHESADVTQVYAERDLQLAWRVAEEIG